MKDLQTLACSSRKIPYCLYIKYDTTRKVDKPGIMYRQQVSELFLTAPGNQTFSDHGVTPLSKHFLYISIMFYMLIAAL